MTGCQFRIRPFPNPTQVECEKPEHLPDDPEHEATLRDYAYPGSQTKLTWMSGDRREFTGNFPGYCTNLGSTGGRQNCRLPAGHPGRCAP
jgi:hypothetical protein